MEQQHIDTIVEALEKQRTIHFTFRNSEARERHMQYVARIDAALSTLRAQAQPPQQLDENGLLPCPFCGSVPYTRYGNGWFEVLCGNENDDCAFAPYVSVDTRENAIAAWNRRAQPPAPQLAANDLGSHPTQERE